MIYGLLAYLKKQHFNNSLVGLLVNPFYFARAGLYTNIKKLAPQMRGKILDVGCGSKPYKHLFQFTEYIGIDIENEGHSHINEDVDMLYDGETIPFPDNHFDCVITNQVLEHIFEPEKFLKELFRVLKPKGKLLLSVPFVWDEHEQPNDYGRYSSFGLKFLLKKNGFTVLEYKKSMSDMRILFQLFNAYIFKVMPFKNRYLHYACTLVFSIPSNILGIISAYFLPKNQDLFLDSIVLVAKS